MTQNVVLMWVFMWAASAVFCAVVAAAKGRSGVGWFLLGAVFGVVGLVAVSGLPPVEHAGTAEVEPPPPPSGNIVAALSVVSLLVILAVWVFAS